jgi:hypothetical protein
MGNLINADELKQRAYNFGLNKFGMLDENIIEFIDTTKSAEAQWVQLTICGKTKYYCSNCQCEAFRDSDGNQHIFKHCQNCGYKMTNFDKLHIDRNKGDINNE